MRVPLSWLKDHVDLPTDVNDLAERISVAGLEVDAIEPLPSGDQVLEIAILPDAARCLSIIGVAREVAAVLRLSARIAPPAALPPMAANDAPADIQLPDASVAFRYAGLLLRNVFVRPSPSWLVDRLAKCGVKSINNIVDITNYVMLEWGQPCHAYDYGVLKQRAVDRPVELITRFARAGETLATLDDQQRTLTPKVLVIADSVSPVAVAGVMGGAETAITDQTRDVLFEVAAFDAITVRRSAQTLKLATDSSYRFSRGIPQQSVDIALRRIAELARQLDVAAPEAVVDKCVRPPSEQVIYLTHRQVERLLGLSLPEAEIHGILKALDFEVETGSSARWPDWAIAEGGFGLALKDGEPLWRCVAPWYRLDVRCSADLVEEVARMVGLERLTQVPLAEPMPAVYSATNFNLEERLRDTLSASGLQEIISYSLTTPEAHHLLGVGPIEASPSYVALSNPMSVERRVMRRSLLVSAVEAMTHNARFTDRIAMFEVGRVFLPEQGDAQRPLEDRRFSIILAGSRNGSDQSAQPTTNAGPFDFYDFSALVRTVMARCGLGDAEWSIVPGASADTFSPRSAKLLVHGEPCGSFGELNPFTQNTLAANFKSVLLGEFRIAPLLERSNRVDRMVTVNKYPPVIEDFSFILPTSTLNSDVVRVLKSHVKNLLMDVQFVSLYEGSSLPNGHKSMTYRLTFRHPDRSPTEAEVLTARTQLIDAMASELGGTLRTQ